MMHEEFEKLAGYEVSYEDYHNIIEPMYMATNLSKVDFIKCLDPKRFSKQYKLAEMKKEIKKLAKIIFEGCGIRIYHDEENRMNDLAKAYAGLKYNLNWVSDLKSYVYFTRGYAYCGIKQDRGCSYLKELVIGRDDIDFERIVLVK